MSDYVRAIRVFYMQTASCQTRISGANIQVSYIGKRLPLLVTMGLVTLRRSDYKQCPLVSVVVRGSRD